MKFISLVSSAALFIFFVMLPINTRSQGLEKFQWENRILILLSEDINSDEMQGQLRLFEGQENELEARKLLIVLVSPAELSTMPESTYPGLSPGKIYDRFKQSDARLEHVLIGLDGGKKLQGELAISTKQLYAVIDAMPMRRAELEDPR